MILRRCQSWGEKPCGAVRKMVWRRSQSSSSMLRGGTNPSIGKRDPRILSDFELKSTGFCESGYDSRRPQTLNRHPVTKVHAPIEHSIPIIHGPWRLDMAAGDMVSRGTHRNSSMDRWTVMISPETWTSPSGSMGNQRRVPKPRKRHELVTKKVLRPYIRGSSEAP